MYKISFFVPVDEAERVKLAMFRAGAGRIGNYEHCSFEVLGTGQFLAMADANPYVGDIGALHKLSELKIEMVCEDSLIREVVDVLKINHPYETPAYDIIKLEEF